MTSSHTAAAVSMSVRNADSSTAELDLTRGCASRSVLTFVLGCVTATATAAPSARATSHLIGDTHVLHRACTRELASDHDATRGSQPPTAARIQLAADSFHWWGSRGAHRAPLVMSIKSRTVKPRRANQG